MLKISLFTGAYFYLMKKYKPTHVMVWNPLLIHHTHFKGICNHFSISFFGVEGGLVPGTVEIDKYGHLVDTSITKNLNSFQTQPLSDNDLEVTREYLKIVRDNKFSKKHQPSKCTLPSNLKKPIIFLAGIDENAVASNSTHYSRRKLFSPYFRSEKELLVELISICRKNNYTLLYKQHPNAQLTSTVHEDDGFFLANDYNALELIDQSDLLVTIGSTLQFHSLVRKKPVLIAGRSPLVDLDIVRSLSSKNDLEKSLNVSLVSIVNHDKFVEYMARLIKYYSYSFSSYSKSIISSNRKRFISLLSSS